MNSYNSGLFAEFLAKMYLRLHGFRIVQSRYITGRNTGRAEIDIIARRRNLMVFIEVKRRPDIKTAWAAITPAQGVRLRRAAENFKRQLLDMDTEFTKAVAEVEKQPEDAFTVDPANDESAASSGDGAPTEPPAADMPPAEGA